MTAAAHLGRTGRWLLALLGGLALVLGPLALTARADDILASYVVDAHLARDGMLQVKATLTPGQQTKSPIVQRFSTRRPAGDTRDYVYELSDLKASAGGQDLGAAVTTDGDDKVITIDSGRASGRPIEISYRVKGAVSKNPSTAGQADSTTFSWHFLQGLNVGVTEVSGVIRTTAQPSSIDCKAGSPVAPHSCTMWQAGTHDAPMPMFNDGPRGPGEIVQITFTSAADTLAANAEVEHHWSLDRAFTVNWPTALATLGALALGSLMLWALHRRAGRDQSALSHPTVIAEFAPVAEGQSEFQLVTDVRPGQIGTVADERVDPVDVTATLLDLAVRGHLRIEQVDPAPQAPIDWIFTRMDGGRGELRPYEKVLLDAVAPVDGAQVTVSHIAEAVGPVIGEVQDALYDDVVEQGWFEHRPDARRNTFRTIAWVALVAALVITGLLVAFTTYGLLGLALVLVALGLLFVSEEMPRRSARGSELLAGLHALASQLQHQRTDQMPRGKELHEISEILPYAVVLGGRERWLDAMVAADGDETPDSTLLSWYHAPADWHLQHLPASLGAFIAAVQGRLFGR